ncbi:MAG: RNA polymerase sigma factor region1.1 domain-containing protein, partial [Bacteroidetes bacterium]|nr:RNA polymerase sigma factor region1.1 domain-containing protein [Bacteroidota bacterium]
KKGKITKEVRLDSTSSARRAIRTKISKKEAPQLRSVSDTILFDGTPEQAKKVEHLIRKGKERHFVTQDEILKEFPTIEDDILFLDALYDRFNKEGIDIVESGVLLDVDGLDETIGKSTFGSFVIICSFSCHGLFRSYGSPL